MLVNESLEDIFKSRALDEIPCGNCDAIFKRSKKSYDSGWRLGYLNASYKQLEDLFGEPEEYVDSKTNFQWVVEDQYKNMLAIYDYSYGIDPLELPFLEEVRWSVGGTNVLVYQDLIHYLVKNNFFKNVS